MAFNKAKALQEAENFLTQGKISQAIRQYFDIFERDPSDVILLNTIGDLYVRNRNVSEGLRQYYRLAAAYVQDGFTLKAIAIYKKIAKLEPDAEEPLLKLVELYQAQRLGREARELYYQVAECYKKKKQNDKALETLRKVVQLDVENATARARLAAFCEEIGRKDEAAQVYLETARLAFRRGDTAAAQSAFKQARELDPDNPQIQLLRAREALALKHPEEVEAILNATPGLKDDPAGRSLLIDSYLALRQPEKAETLVLDSFHANPADFSPLASFVSVCVDAGQFDRASKALTAVADELIEQGNTSSLMESLRLIWSKSPQHLPALELILRICNETGDEYALPEILEALGQAYVQGEQFEKAEQSFQRLVDRQPANERYKALLRQVLQKQGKEFGKARVADLSASAAAATEEGGVAAPAASAFRATDREAIVKEALENSELLAHYQLVRKAVAELEKVLEIFPDETEIHRRLVGMCWREMPERAEQAARALERIHRERGDEQAAKQFAQMAGGREGPGAGVVPLHEVRVPALGPEPIPPRPAQVTAPAAGELELAAEFSLAPLEEAEAAPTPHISSTASPGVTFELPRPPEPEALAATPAQTPFDLFAVPGVEPPTRTASGTSSDASSPPPAPATSVGASAPPAPKAPPPAPLALPIHLATSALSAPPPAPASEVQEIDLSEDWESFQARMATASVAPETARETASFNYDESRIELNFYLQNGFVEEARKAVEELQRKHPGEPRIAELRALVEARTEKIPTKAPLGAAGEATDNLRDDLAQALAFVVGGLAEPVSPPVPPSSPTAASAAGPASPLSRLLKEIREPPSAGPVGEDDSLSHYELGVAFREMNLPDAAIGEFQKVVKSARKGYYPPNYLQACSLLAICYMDKGMPPVGARARKAVEELRRKHPGDPRIAELRALVEAHTGAAVAKVPEEQPAETVKPTFPVAGAPPAKEPVKQRELPSGHIAPKPEPRPAGPPGSSGEEKIPTEAPLGLARDATDGLRHDLAEAFESAVGGLAEHFPPPAPPCSLSAGPAAGPVSSLSGLLEEIGEAPSTGPVGEEDSQSHYDLGVAFREMNLLDEAIGEFQKVVRDAGKGHYPPNYLQACTLLATCFMERGMAAVAVKWYGRALETPELDDQALLALQYDLGVAYEQAGDLPRALEKFTEVYGQNIDYRDVAEKLRTFRQKGS